MNCDTVRFLMLDIGFIDCHLVNKLSIFKADGPSSKGFDYVSYIY